jgi:HK97 family phage prohead protease
MTPKAEREIRQTQQFNVGENEMVIEGYALVFNQETVLFEIKGTEYRESIDRNALNDADMTDVILNYKHGGKVFARTRNGTLELRVDEKGLYFKAKLSGTEEGRKLYEEIKGGYLEKCSYAYTVSEDTINKNLRIVKRIKKIYDISIVDIPAYEQTSVIARSRFESEEEKRIKAMEIANLRKTLILKTYL